MIDGEYDRLVVEILAAESEVRVSVASALDSLKARAERGSR